MSNIIDIFNTDVGLSDDRVDYISGNGVPIGTTGITDLARQGTRWVDIDTGLVYTKITATSSAIDWERLALASELGTPSTTEFNGVTAAQVVASALVDDALGIHIAIGVSNPLVQDERITGVIWVSHNGIATADATTIRRVIFARHRYGPITGLMIDYTLTGAGAAQAFNVTIESTTSVDVRVQPVILAI